MSICLIPARGGSKRIPRKNIKPFLGKPMIAWSIEAALSSGCFERVMVSTDDAEIASVARDFGADVPFMRPPELSDDHATTIAVVRHALDWLEREDALPEALCCLYATAPFVEADDLQRGADALKGTQWVIPVTSFPHPIQRALRKDAAGDLSMLDRALYETRSQDLEETYHDAGQFYWATAKGWRSDAGPYRDETRALVLPRRRVQDIDTPEDWARAEVLMEVLQRRSQAG